MRHKIHILLTILLLNYVSPLMGVNIGNVSNAASTYNTGTPAFSGAGNNVFCYAIMQGGFSMVAGTGLTWNTFCPVIGTVTMGGGNITLTKDFVMSGAATFANGGTFTCGGFSVICPQDNVQFPFNSTPFTINGGTLKLNSPAAFNTTMNFQGTSILDGGGNVITIGIGGAIAVATGGSLLIKNATLQGIAGTQLSCADNTAALSLQNVTIIQDGNATFNQGIMNILNDVEITGSSVFAFSSTNSLNINSYATLMFDLGSTFSYDTTNASLVKFTDASAQLYLHGATLYTTGTGINLTKGTLNIDQTSIVSSTGTLGVTIGSCVSANDLQVNLLPNAQLTVSQGLLNYKNVNATSFNMFNGNVLLSVGANTTLNVYKNLTGQGSVIFGNNTTLGTAPGVSLAINSLQQGTISFTSLAAC